MLRLILKEKEGVVCCPIYHIYREERISNIILATLPTYLYPLSPCMISRSY